MKYLLTLWTVLLVGLCFSASTRANNFILNPVGDTLIGKVEYVEAAEEDTLLDIARKYKFGLEDMKLSNPGVDTWLPGEGQNIVLPGQFVLPVAPKEGIVLNIPEMRLYYYPPNTEGGVTEVITYPLGIGREGWGTPYIRTQVVEKKEKPTWYPPESIRQEHEEEGDPLPAVVPPGPDNPLGEYAMRLGRRDYLIHGTNKPYGIGMRVSHGCIRLYPEDIAALFDTVSLKTPVNIINQPYKVGVKKDIIYLEAHPFLMEDKAKYENNLTSVIALILRLANGRDYEINEDLAYDTINQATGLPVTIGRYVPQVKQVMTEESRDIKPKSQ